MKRFFPPFLILVLLFPQIVAASSFDPSYIISDAEFQNTESMTKEEVSQFLRQRNGILKEYATIDIDGIERKASEIIFRAAAQYTLNPQVLLVTLQKEQSLLEDPMPTMRDLDWAAGYGVCDDCATNDPGIQKFRGFTAQVYGAAKRLREYLDNPNLFSWIKANQVVVIDGLSVIPLTAATRALFLYTPHISGNKRFWALWNKYFNKPYPDGSLLKEIGNAKLWIIEDGSRRPFTGFTIGSARFDPRLIVEVSHDDLLRYNERASEKFQNYSLLRSPKGTIYLLVDGIRRGIASKLVFKTLGFNPEEVVDVKANDLKVYPEGAPITLKSGYPQGALLQNKKTGAIYFVQDGTKHPIPSRLILTARFSSPHITPVSMDELSRYTDDTPLGFPDGTLMSGEGPERYVISGGMRRQFVSDTVFTDLGYRVENIIKVPENILAIHPIGKMIDIAEIPEDILLPATK